MACLLLNTLESMATPCSVNAKGEYFGRFPRPLFSKVTICDLKESHSFFVNSNAGSSV